jgi:hypothetical protein
MITSFNEQLANNLQEIEVPVFIENIAYWIRKNYANHRHFHENRYWTYNSYPAFTKLFPFWSLRTIRCIVKRAEEAGLLIIGNFNKKSYDNTNWYTLTDKALQYFPALSGLILDTPVKSDSTPVNIDRPIPKHILQSNINITNSESGDSAVVVAKKEVTRKKPSIELQELIEIYRQEFPNNPQPHAKLISTNLKKALNGFIKRWPEVEPEGKPLNYEMFRRYMQMLKTVAPKFALGEYTTPDGNKKKNSLETFCRWNTLVKFLENAYS